MRVTRALGTPFQSEIITHYHTIVFNVPFRDLVSQCRPEGFGPKNFPRSYTGVEQVADSSELRLVIRGAPERLEGVWVGRNERIPRRLEGRGVSSGNHIRISAIPFPNDRYA